MDSGFSIHTHIRLRVVFVVRIVDVVVVVIAGGDRDPPHQRRSYILFAR